MLDGLYEKLNAYAQTDFYPFHMPGHTDVISIRRTNRPIVPNTVMDTISPSRARPVPEGVVVVFIGASEKRN